MPPTVAEIEAYRREGFVVPEYRLPPAQLAEMRAALERLMEENPDLPPERLIAPHIPRAADKASPVYGAFFRLASDPAILDLVEGAAGPDIVLWGSSVFCKPAGTGRAVPWHQDGRYWPIRPLATTSCWIAFDDATVENGCLRALPGSHRARKLFPHRLVDDPEKVLNRELDAGAFDEDEAVDIELEAGRMVLFDCYLMHGSNANRSGSRRAGYSIQYMPASSHYDRWMDLALGSNDVRYDLKTRPIWLLRGEDWNGRNDFRIGKEGYGFDVARADTG